MKAIQRRIITLLVCCTFFLVLVLEFVGLGIMNRTLTKDSTQIMKLLCAEQAGDLNEYIHSVEQSVDTLHQVAVDGLKLCGEALLGEAVRNESDREVVREIVLREYVADVEAVSKILADNTEGAMTVYYRFNPELFDPKEGFFSVKYGTEGFESFPTTDLSLYEKNDMEHVFWYYEPVNAGKAIWLDPYPNDNIGVEMISYVSPVFFDDQVVGVVGMDIDIVTWREKVKEISLYKTGFAVLSDSVGNIIYHPDYQDGVKRTEAPEAVETINFYLREALWQTDGYDYELDARERAMVSMQLDNGMYFGVVVPLDEVAEPGRLLMVETVLLAMGIVALFSLFSVRICKRIIKVAYTDVMTGAKNKTAYEETVEEISQEIRNRVVKFALIMFDINNLKTTNDTYGHDQGDKLIITAAALLQNVFGTDNVFRIGGDEFVVLLRHEAADSYQQKLQEFACQLDAMNNMEHFVWGETKVARGATSYDYHTDAAYGDVFRRADALMYENKKLQKSKS